MTLNNELVKEISEKIEKEVNFFLKEIKIHGINDILEPTFLSGFMAGFLFRLENKKYDDDELIIVLGRIITKRIIEK